MKKIVMYAGLGIVGAVLLAGYAWRRGGGTVQNAVASAVTKGIGAAGDAASGVILGIGDVVGVPRTDADQCDQALASGNNLDALIYCPAGTFNRGVFGSYMPQNVGGYRLEGRNYPMPIEREASHAPSFGSGAAYSPPIQMSEIYGA